MADSTLVAGAVAVVVVALVALAVAEVGRRRPGSRPGDVDHRWYSRLFSAWDRRRGGV
jgi:hypothetical protein